MLFKVIVQDIPMGIIWLLLLLLWLLRVRPLVLSKTLSQIWEIKFTYVIV